MRNHDTWGTHVDGSPIPEGFKRLDLPCKRRDLWDLLFARKAFHYRVFDLKSELLYVLIPESDYEPVFQKLAASIAENQSRIAAKREQQSRTEKVASGLNVKEAIISGCQAAARLDAGESRTKAMTMIDAWVIFLRDAGYFSHTGGTFAQREVYFVVEGVSYRYVTQVNMPSFSAVEHHALLYRAGESCFDEDMIILDASLKKLKMSGLIEREKTREEWNRILEAKALATRHRQDEKRIEAERIERIRKEQLRVAKNERAQSRRYEKKYGIVRTPERTKKQAYEAGLRTVAYYTRPSVCRIPRDGERPEIVKGEEFFAESQTERLLSKAAGKREGLVLREHAVPARRYYFRKAKKHYLVYRESEFVSAHKAEDKSSS